MEIVLTLLTLITVIVALLLIFIILIQRSKAGGGLGGLATTSSGVEEAFGSSAGNVLSKATVWLSLVFLVTTLMIGIIQKNRDAGRDLMDDGMEEPADKGSGDSSGRADDADLADPGLPPADPEARGTDTPAGGATVPENGGIIPVEGEPESDPN